jgi:ABC-2 type transport system permease protein
MNGALWKKNIHDSLLLFSGLAFLVTVFGWFRVKIVGKIDTGRFKQIVDLLPDDWERFASVEFDWMVSYLGRTATTLDEPMLILLISIWAVVRGSDVVSGGLGRGTLEMILAQPVSRMKYYFIHNFVTTIGLALLCLLIWLGMMIAVETVSIEESVYPEVKIPLTTYRIPLTFVDPDKVSVPLSDHVNSFKFWPGILNVFCLGVFMTGLSAMLSAFDRFRWRTLGIAIGIYFLSAMAKLGSMAAESFAWLKYLTYFSFYDAVLFIKLYDEDPASQLAWVNLTETGEFTGVGPAGCNLFLAMLGVAFLLVGARVFDRRDLPAPV